MIKSLNFLKKEKGRKNMIYSCYPIIIFRENREMTNNNQIGENKEQTIFDHKGNTIMTEDREIHIISKFEEPLIVVLANVLSDEECDELIEMSKNKMERSKIGSSRDVNDIRTSSGAFLEDNELTSKIEKRISSIMNVPVAHGEGLHILNYEVDQQYKAHYDYFAEHSDQLLTIVLVRL